MKKTKKKTAKSLLERTKEIGQKYGVRVTDMSERGVRGIGVLGGVRRGQGAKKGDTTDT